jgi:hypothetical protein
MNLNPLLLPIALKRQSRKHDHSLFLYIHLLILTQPSGARHELNKKISNPDLSGKRLQKKDTTPKKAVVSKLHECKKIA